MKLRRLEFLLRYRLQICLQNPHRERRMWMMLLAFSVPMIMFLHITLVCMRALNPPSHTPGPYVTYFKERLWSKNKVKTILFWTPNFGDPLWGQKGKDTFGKCPVNSCRITSNKSEFEDSDALLFHSRAVWNYFKGYTLPSHHPPHQVWILNDGEPPPHVYLNMKDYNNIFNWTFWYRSEADVRTLSGRMVRIEDESVSWESETNTFLRSAGETYRDIEKPAIGAQIVKHNYYSEKDKFASWTASNCKDQGRRQRIVNRLRRYLDIDTYGACGDKKLPCDDFLCPEYLSAYRFYLSFENSVCRDYVTEKFWLALKRGQIPVVYGGADYSSFAPRSSYIDVRDFDSIEHLAQYIKKVNASQELFNSFMWWKRFYKVHITPDPWCDLCRALYDRGKPAQVYSDLDGWYRNDSCGQFSVLDAIGRFIEGMLLKYNIIS